jgi:D-alanyl-D-alanine dipeptidase
MEAMSRRFSLLAGALLRRAMEAEGVSVYDAEWGHLDYRDWARRPVLNLTFEQLSERHDH